MSAKHLPKRLIARNYSLYAEDGKTPVADACLNTTQYNDVAIAARIAACWNACEELDVDLLARFGLGTATGSEIYRLREQNAELLEACKLLIAYCDKNSPMGDSLWSIQQIRAAIKKADGEQQ